MESDTTTRPEIVTDEHLEFLDELRESGVTNMFGAAPYVQEEFDLERDEARAILAYWMKSFGSPDRLSDAAGARRIARLNAQSRLRS